MPHDVHQDALELGTDQGVRRLWFAALGVGPEENKPTNANADSDRACTTHATDAAARAGIFQ